MGTLPAQSDNRLGHLPRHEPGLTMRRTGALDQALRALVAISTKPLVAGLAADAAVRAKHCHRQLTTQTVRDKTNFSSMRQVSFHGIGRLLSDP